MSRLSKAKERFFNERINASSTPPKYSRINREWNNSDEKTNALFVGVRIDIETKFESNYQQYNDL